MPQLKMFAPVQAKCSTCGTAFVPLSKDIIREWDREFELDDDWLSTRNWAIDRIYQEQLHSCSVDCHQAMVARMKVLEIQEAWERANRRYR